MFMFIGLLIVFKNDQKNIIFRIEKQMDHNEQTTRSELLKTKKKTMI